MGEMFSKFFHDHAFPSGLSEQSKVKLQQDLKVVEGQMTNYIDELDEGFKYRDRLIDKLIEENRKLKVENDQLQKEKERILKDHPPVVVTIHKDEGNLTEPFSYNQ